MNSVIKTIIKGKFPFYKQPDSMDCGPTCLRMIAKHYGKNYSIPYLREKCYIDREGVSLLGISEAAECIGFRSLGVKIPLNSKNGDASLKNAPLPSIVHWNQNHFVVVYKITNRKIFIADPQESKIVLTHDQFEKSYSNGSREGTALILETTPEFYKKDAEEGVAKGFGFLIPYITPHKKLIVQLVIGLFVATVFQLIFPFLTQSLVDIGINSKDVKFIYIVLLGQLMIFAGQTVVRFIHGWILLHISIRLNFGLIADFLIKLMKLPLGFFDSKHIGDLLQRISDHQRIESFLTQSALSIVLSILNVIVFGVVLAIYSTKIFLIFFVASIAYISWVMVFMKKRKDVDYKAFQEMANNQDSLIEMIYGMSEIKLQGSQLKRRWKWAKIQARLFRTQVKSLAITQYQDGGALSINQLKDILITFVAATAVVDNQITLGAMLAIQYIIGQLNAPLQQFVTFIRSAQDASISLERLKEIHVKEEEELSEDKKVASIEGGDLILNNVSFRYTPISNNVLTNVTCKIPYGKTTAIVGTSGSGKTTLIKLLLGFYPATEGRIRVGNLLLENIYKKVWRAKCGVVMQEGYIFSDTIANNIAESEPETQINRVIEACRTAHILDFIEQLPQGFNTMIGAKGNSVSQGQKQRILIARAVYKNPDYLFFDEATNALDANNERVILNNLNEFLKDKTAIVVAHRLSTVKHADQIIVLDQGKIVEVGNHEALVEKKGHYYTLVKNQLELGQ